MIRLTSDDLRQIADMIDTREKYDNMCGIVYVTINENWAGRKTLQFEQPCSYSECNSYYYRFVEK